MLSYFQCLGERIEQKWLVYSYDEEIFPQLVLDELDRDPPSKQVTVADIIAWVFDSQEFRQPNANNLFGEPPVMLFQAPRFYIEALFWFSSTTEIHEHGFSGAFSVLTGSSVHSHWHFELKRTINSRMQCGQLKRVATEILRPGCLQPIYSGNRLIHQLFHLEEPSVTIVVRTYIDRNRLPQFNYLPPGIGIDSEDRDGLRTRRLILLEGMTCGKIDGLREYVRRIIENGDLETLFHAFSMMTRRRLDKDLLKEFYQLARLRHGEVVDLFQQVCEGERRTRIVTALRSKVHEPGGRFLLALLMLISDRDAIFKTIHLQFPEIEPLDAIETWLKEISGNETIGFEFNDLNRCIFRGLAEGLDTESLLHRLTDHLGDSVTAHRDALIEHTRKIASSLLFLPLFAGTPFLNESRADLAESGK